MVSSLVSSDFYTISTQKSLVHRGEMMKYHKNYVISFARIFLAVAGPFGYSFSLVCFFHNRLDPFEKMNQKIHEIQVLLFSTYGPFKIGLLGNESFRNVIYVYWCSDI